MLSTYTSNDWVCDDNGCLPKVVHASSKHSRIENERVGVADDSPFLPEI